MRVLIIHNYYQKRGGEDALVRAQIDLLRKRGNEVIHYYKENSAILGFDLRKKILFFPETIFSFKAYHEIKRLLLKEKPDVVHVHNVFPLISPSVYTALKDSGIPIVQTLHNFRFLCPNGFFYVNGKICEKCKYGNTIYSVLKRCYRGSYLLSALYALTIGFHRAIRSFNKIDHFIALTHFTAQKFVESDFITSDRISILPNFIPRAFKKSENRKELYFLYLGRLSDEKGLRTLLDAMKELPEIYLKIAGDGPLKSYLKDFIERKNLKNVEYLGFLKSQKKANVLKKALVLVLPSLWYESFPITALEAMANSTSILASNIGSLPFIVKDRRTGVLSHPGDKKDLKEKIINLWKNPELSLKMGRYGREVFEAKYSEQAHYKGLIKIYERLSRLERDR